MERLWDSQSLQKDFESGLGCCRTSKKQKQKPTIWWPSVYPRHRVAWLHHEKNVKVFPAISVTYFSTPSRPPIPQHTSHALSTLQPFLVYIAFPPTGLAFLLQTPSPVLILGQTNWFLSLLLHLATASCWGNPGITQGLGAHLLPSPLLDPCQLTGSFPQPHSSVSLPQHDLKGLLLLTLFSLYPIPFHHFSDHFYTSRLYCILY